MTSVSVWLLHFSPIESPALSEFFQQLVSLNYSCIHHTKMRYYCFIGSEYFGKMWDVVQTQWTSELNPLLDSSTQGKMLIFFFVRNKPRCDLPINLIEWTHSIIRSVIFFISIQFHFNFNPISISIQFQFK